MAERADTPSVTREIVLTDVTRMREGRICIAGVDDEGRCVRPVVPDGNLWEAFLTSVPGVTVRPFSQLSLAFLESKPDPPHTEDRLFNPWTMQFVRQLSRSEAAALLQGILDPSVADIFGASVHHDEGWYVMHGEGARSLGTITPSKVNDVLVFAEDDGRIRVRIAFEDAAGVAYRLSVTDLSLLRWCREQCAKDGNPSLVAQRLWRSLQKPGRFLRIGLARHWDKHPDRCYLQITGVY